MRIAKKFFLCFLLVIMPEILFAFDGTITVMGEELIIKEKRILKEDTIVSKKDVSSEMVASSAVSLFDDLSETLKTLPGVVTSGDFSGALYIRGCYPMETIFILDNVFISWPYRWGGGLTFFNTDLIKKIDFYAGGYPAQGNQALGGIIDVYYKEGDKEKRKGEVELSPTTMAFRLEGPIKKERSSYFFSTNRTHYDLVAKWFIEVDEKDVALPYFSDHYLKLYVEPSYKDMVSFMALSVGEGMDMEMKEEYGSPDDEEGHFKYEYTKDIFSTTYKHIFSSSLYNELILSYLEDKGDFRFYSPEEPVNSDFLYIEYTLRNDLTFINGPHEIKTGIITWQNNGNEHTLYKWTDVEEVNGILTEVSHSEDIRWDGTVHYTGTYIWDKWKTAFGPIIDYGIRYEFFDMTEESLISPRLSICIPLESARIKVAIGEYSQYPRDSHQLDENEGNPDLSAQRSRQYIVGYERALGDNKKIRIEGYYSDLSKLIINDPIKNYDNEGEGYSKGIEFFFQKKEEGRWNGWVSYSFNESRREEGISKFSSNTWIIEKILYPIDQERQHVFSSVLNYKLTPRWTANLKSIYYSGNPYTPIIGADSQTFGTTTMYHPIYGGYKSERMPDYFKIDLAFTRSQRWGEWYIQFLNLTDQKNVYNYYYSEDYSERKEFKMLPFMVLGGVKVKF